METLNFIYDAKLYRNTYTLYSISVDNCDLIRDTTLVAQQWKRLISTYVFPESPCQINLPDHICEQLLEPVDPIVSPPNPERLDLAIDYAYEIITEDALVPFARRLYTEDTYACAIRSIYLPVPKPNQLCSSHFLSQDPSCPVNDKINKMQAKEQHTQNLKFRCRKAFRLMTLIQDYFRQAVMTPLKIRIHTQKEGPNTTRYLFKRIIISKTQ
jgi:hypothetical protein